ncbi:TBC1 domain family member 15-like [Uloborus diversus]|uniref:TBC1 domain family member 15-like n=1 Tax=Uloborus diversus TaxID=327109 RepID=UPI002408FFEB|nr:TBC1 domain family member 15-like [Uloborus diversus]
MDKRKREVKFTQENVVVKMVGPLKDEASYEGTLMIVEERHGPEIEWHPKSKIKTSEDRNVSPDSENLDWEDVTSSVEYKVHSEDHDESLDAVEIKSVPTPNIIKFDIPDLKSFIRTEGESSYKVVVTFLLKDGTHVPALHFQSDDFGKFCAAIDNYVRFKRSKKENNLYLVIDPKVDALEKSFSELDLFSDSKSHIITKLIHDPYNTAMGGFSKVTNYLVDYMLYGNGAENSTKCSEDELKGFMSENLLHVDIDHQEEPGFEMITCIELPPRPEVKREDPVTLEEWNSFLDSESRIMNAESLKKRIFNGGLVHSIRSEAWKYLLGFYSFEATNKDKMVIRKKREEDYFRMKLQWKSIDADQESRFSALRERKSLIEKDVSRTDRTHPFYEGENNANINMLQDILMTYCMYNFDLGYVQGMSDLLSPILVVMQNELDAFWCFAGWLKNIGVNFELEQQGMKNQLQDLHRLLHFVDSHLCSYLEKHDSGNLYFAFRWLLILFKRDFKFMEIMRLWEVLWTGLPCKNFHLLICIAILDSEKTTIMENEFGLTEILKHVNEMSYKINLDDTLCKAEAIYLQIKNSKYQSDVVRTILGLEAVTPGPEIRLLRERVRTEKKPTVSLSIDKDLSGTSSSDNMDDYVDLEQHSYQLPFDLFS